MSILVWILQILLVPVASPLCVGIIRKIKAKLQNRKGASIFQPYSDVWKLMNKDEVISKDASWISYWAPFVVFASTLVAGASIPLFASFLRNTVTGDMLVVVYTLSIGTFFLALSGIDTGGAFGGFGSSREMTVSSLAEGGLIFSLLAAALVSGTTNLFSISGSGVVSLGYSLTPVILTLLSFVGFFIVLLAETARFPFDNPATHLELTMIHEAMIIEYSGKRLALMEWASANKLFIFSALAVNIFFPLGIATTLGVGAIVGGLVYLALKMFVVCVAIALIESVMAKFRFFRLPDLLISSFVISCLAIGLIL